MQKFFWYMVPLAVLWFAVMLVCATVEGDGILLWLILAVASILSLGICLWQKLTRIEQKLNKLLEQKSTEER